VRSREAAILASSSITSQSLQPHLDLTLCRVCVLPSGVVVRPSTSFHGRDRRVFFPCFSPSDVVVIIVPFTSPLRLWQQVSLSCLFFPSFLCCSPSRVVIVSTPLLHARSSTQSPLSFLYRRPPIVSSPLLAPPCGSAPCFLPCLNYGRYRFPPTTLQRLLRGGKQPSRRCFFVCRDL